MGHINSRTKGNKNERELSALFKQWTGRTFARVPSSGGLSWKTANAKGDIICTKEGHYFPFCIEAKSYKDINFQHLLYLPKPKILEFWAQCIRDAKIAKKVPLLFMRYNGMPKNVHFVVLEHKFFKEYWDSEPTKEYLVLGKKKLVILHSHDLFSLDYNKLKASTKKYLGYGKKK